MIDKDTLIIVGVTNSYQKSIQKYVKLYKSIHYFWLKNDVFFIWLHIAYGI